MAKSSVSGASASSPSASTISDSSPEARKTATLELTSSPIGPLVPIAHKQQSKPLSTRPHAVQGTDRRKRLAANARERKRMHLLNKAYDKLRKRLADADNKSKYDVLVQAKEYIQALASICETHDKQHRSEPLADEPLRAASSAKPALAERHAGASQPATSYGALGSPVPANWPTGSNVASAARPIKLESSHDSTRTRPPCDELPYSPYSPYSPCLSHADSETRSPCSSTAGPNLGAPACSTPNWITPITGPGHGAPKTHHKQLPPNNPQPGSATLIYNRDSHQISPENLSCSTLVNSPPTSLSDSLAQLRPDYLPRIAQFDFNQQVSVASHLTHQLNRLASADIYHQYAQAFHHCTQRAT